MFQLSALIFVVIWRSISLNFAFYQIEYECIECDPEKHPSITILQMILAQKISEIEFALFYPHVLTNIWKREWVKIDMTSLRDGPVFNFKYYIFREELFLAHGGEVPHEDLHGEQGKDCPTQPGSSQRRKVLLPQDEPLRRSGQFTAIMRNKNGSYIRP